MRVLQVGHNAVSTMGGTPGAIRDVRRALGGDVVSFTSPSLLEEDPEGTVHVPQSDSVLGRAYGTPRRGAAAAADACLARADVVFVHGCFRYHYQWAVREARQRALPYVIFPHGSLDPYVFSYRGLPKRAWWRAVGQPGLEQAAGIVCMTRRELHKAAVRSRLPQRRHVVHLPVPLPPAADDAALRARMRERLGIGPDAFVALFLGRFDPFKRLQSMVEGFSTAAVPDLHLVLAGPESPDVTGAELRTLASPASAARLHLPGALYGDDKRAVFAAADVFVAVSARENFGYSLCEALAAGVPAIMGPGNDLAPELPDCGWRLDRDDSLAIARALAECAAAPTDLLRARGARGRDWVREHLNAEQFRQRLLEICEGAKP